MNSRVVGSPQANRLFGPKSREALTDREHRRSGAWSPPPRTPSPPPEPVVPKVIYVPLPMPPRTSTEDYWAQRLSAVSDDARLMCGLPSLALTNEPRLPWNPSAPPPSSEESAVSDATTASSQCAPLLPERKPSFWRRVLMALRCLRGR